MEIVKDYLTENKYSRPGKKRHDTQALIVHWVANPGSTAKQNRDFFESLKDGLPSGSGRWFASTTYIIGIQGEIVQCVPEDELTYHVGSKSYTPLAKELFGKYTANAYQATPNWVTLGVELCHPDMSGRFAPETLSSAIELFANMCYRYHLTQEDIYRHYDIVGWKDCPKWFVTHPDRFKDFKREVGKRIKTVVLEMESA